MQQQTQQIQQQQAPAAGGNYDSRLGTLEYAVSNIATRLDSIATKLDNQGKVPWGTIISAGLATVGLTVTIIGSIGALAFSPLSAGIADMKAAVSKIETSYQRFVPREDLDARFAVLSQRRDDLQRLTDARVERVERDLDTAAKQIVPRGEHDSYRQLQQRDYDLLRNRVERVEGRFEKRSDVLGRDIERLEDRTVPRVELQGRLEAQDRALGVVRGELDEHMRAFNDRQQRRIDTLETGPRK